MYLLLLHLISSVIISHSPVKGNKTVSSTRLLSLAMVDLNLVNSIKSIIWNASFNNYQIKTCYKPNERFGNNTKIKTNCLKNPAYSNEDTHTVSYEETIDHIINVYWKHNIQEKYIASKHSMKLYDIQF